MKKLVQLIGAACIVAATLTGCVSSHSVTSEAIREAQASARPTVDEKKIATRPVSVTATAQSAQAAIDRAVYWFYAAAVLCFIAAGVLAYFGMYLPAIKLGLAGVILPVAGTIIVLHWLLLVVLALVGAAVAIVYERYKNKPAGALAADVQGVIQTAEKMVAKPTAAASSSSIFS